MTIRYDGKVAIVTGAGQGLGRSHAIELAGRGAKVVINDLGGAKDGTGGSSEAARAVVAEIEAAGGEAMANGANVAKYDEVEAMVKQAMDKWGRVDILVNNAGILRDKSFAKGTLDDFKLVPLAVGDATPAEVAEVLERLWGGPETLIVISSDLSHFLPYATAQQTDRATALDILALKPTISHEQACGGTPVNGLLLAARRHGLQPRLLDQCNSGDTAGDRQRVVGYASFSFAPETSDAGA